MGHKDTSLLAVALVIGVSVKVVSENVKETALSQLNQTSSSVGSEDEDVG
jgi:hypothetical protein